MKKIVQDLIDKMDDDNINDFQLKKNEQVKILMYNNSNTNLIEQIRYSYYFLNYLYNYW